MPDAPLWVFLQGVVVGFVIAAPVGPVGILCIRRALVDGRVAAFVAGLGAATADTVFGAIAALGLTLISDALLHYRFGLSLLGGGFLGVMGWRSWQAAHREDHSGDGPLPTVHLGLVKDFALSLLVTLTNPATILAFMAVFASLGAMTLASDLTRAGFMIGGVFCGSALWWLTLSGLASLARNRFSPQWMARLNKGSGLLLLLFGGGIVVSAFWT